MPDLVTPAGRKDAIVWLFDRAAKLPQDKAQNCIQMAYGIDPEVAAEIEGAR
jgi:hypothetical protein